MPSTTWFRNGARSLRRAAGRTHRRAESLPRLPFAVAFAMALVALVVAVEFRPPSEEVAVEVDEHPSDAEEMWYGGGFPTEEVELEIVEYGVSRVVVQELPRLVIGLVVRNPYDRDMSTGAVSLTSVTQDGNPVRIEDFYIGTIPPETTVSVGYVASGGGDLPVEAMRLEASEPAFLYDDPEAEGADVFSPAPVLPEATLVETEPLLSPDGYRLRYRLDAPEAAEVQVTILFRDGEGRLLGGIPAGGEPFSMFHDGWTTHRFPVEEGETLHHVDVPEAWMPEGTDPDRFEVGPSV
ncbi:hypothetical protein LO763_21030 [Glycomyces sp. A-F 0318]|uniref:hypothetical protein n=1 Tax=Glycomyces amatae TaxID=2881355 RepID=UPI001E2AC0BF|nr:hypothetical protein [Glycomyces amatae]MCD0446099.1 hypothetical protein [Glycomyces amatae]